MKLLSLTLVAAASVLFTQQASANPRDVAARAISLVKQMVATDTTNPPGNEEKAVRIMKARLDEAGIPNEAFEFAPGRQNIVARLKGDGTKKPMLILAHSDVVPSAGQSWDTDPHQATEKDGYIYGRGVLDDLIFGTMAAETMIEIKKSGVQLSRDIIFAFTGDEERGGLGIQYILKNRPELVQAEFALNEGAAVITDAQGTPVSVSVAPAEKTYMDFRVNVINVPGGPSWRPLPQNAILYLSKAMLKMARTEFPIMLSDLTRTYFRKVAPTKEPAMKKAMLEIANSTGTPSAEVVAMVAHDPIAYAMLKTSCVPTMEKAGIGENVLATSASANVNCRILPGQTVDQTEAALVASMKTDATLKSLIENTDSSKPRITIERNMTFGQESPISPLDSPVFSAMEAVTQKLMGPHVPVIPSLLVATSDSRWLRIHGIPAYGVTGVYLTADDIGRVHNANERISIKGTYEAAPYWYELLLKLAGR